MDKKKKAFALEYKKEFIAPKVTSSGKGIIADKIIQKAKENKIPIHQDKKMAEELEKVDIGDSIPPELYQVVAQVLVFVSNLEKEGASWYEAKFS